MNDEELAARRKESAKHLRTIGAALVGFHHANGREPRGFGEIVDWLGSARLFESPLDGVRFVRTPQSLFCGRHRIIAFEACARGSVNVLWGDGRVEALPEEVAARHVADFRRNGRRGITRRWSGPAGRGSL